MLESSTNVPQQYFSVSTNTTVYIMGYVILTGGTATQFGGLYAVQI